MKPLHALTDAEFVALARQAVQLPDAPAAWVDAAIARFQPAAAPVTAAEVARSLGRLICAVLSVDSWAPAPGQALAVRSAGADARHLLYSAEGRDIDLRVAPHAGHPPYYALAGQVLGPDESGKVQVYRADATDAPPVAQTALDEMGEFHLDALPEGRYQLTLLLGEDRIELPTLNVGPAQR